MTEASACSIENIFDEADEEQLEEVDIQQYANYFKTSGPGQVVFKGTLAPIMKILNTFRKEGDSGLCDVILEINGRDLSAHRIILAANSRFFCSMFNSRMNDSGTKRVTLNSLKYSAMSSILEYFYTRSLTINTENVAELLEASSFLLLQPVRKACEQVLAKSLRREKCFSVRQLALKFDSQNLLERTTVFIDKWFHSITEGDCTTEFLNLSFEEVASLISRNQVMVVREQNVFLALLKWVRCDVKNRIGQLPQLMKHLKFASIPKDFLQEQLDKEPLLEEEQCQNLLKQLIESDNSLNLSHRPSVKVKNIIVGLGSSLFLYDIDTNELRQLPLTSKPWQVLSQSLLVTSENTIFNFFGSFVEGVTFLHKICTTSGYFEKISLRLPTQRIDYTACVFNGCAYVIGGIWQHFMHNTVEKFDPENNIWHSVASLNKSRYGLVSVATECNIFAIGGSVSIGFERNKFVGVVEKYDPIQNIWYFVAPMPTKRANLFAAYTHGKVYCVGGENELPQTLSNCDIYDIATDVWTFVTPLPRPHNYPIHITSIVATEDGVAVVTPSLEGDFDSVIFNTSSCIWEKHKLIKPGKSKGPYILCNMKLQAFYLQDLPFIEYLDCDALDKYVSDDDDDEEEEVDDDDDDNTGTYDSINFSDCTDDELVNNDLITDNDID